MVRSLSISAADGPGVVSATALQEVRVEFNSVRHGVPNKRTFVNSARCPLMQRLAGIPKAGMRLLRRQIERLPPYPALFVLAGPLAVVEDLKPAKGTGSPAHWGCCLPMRSVYLSPIGWSSSSNQNCSPCPGLHGHGRGLSRPGTKRGAGWRPAPSCWRDRLVHSESKIL